jgi:hypothetical protein
MKASSSVRSATQQGLDDEGMDAAIKGGLDPLAEVPTIVYFDLEASVGDFVNFVPDTLAKV